MYIYSSLRKEGLDVLDVSVYAPKCFDVTIQNKHNNIMLKNIMLIISSNFEVKFDDINGRYSRYF